MIPPMERHLNKVEVSEENAVPVHYNTQQHVACSPGSTPISLPTRTWSR